MTDLDIIKECRQTGKNKTITNKLLRKGLEQMSEPVQYEKPMTTVEDLKAQIKVLQSKLSFLEEVETHKTPCEIAYKRVYGEYPMDEPFWIVFKKGYEAATQDYKVGEYQEPAKDKVPLYKRFENEGAYGQLYYDNALKVVRGFLMDEGVIECEDEEYITITLQKSLLDVPND